ncbi:MAG: energy-coupling factor transporter ATPase [Clostridia bacterium]|nr:energy-coupling factor transporter ATPase [Clostridia bacterium]
MSVLSVKNLKYEYSKGTPFQIGALKGVSVDFEYGEIVGVIGHTGSGKSTLLQHLNGLLKPESGEVFFENENIWDSKENVRKCRFGVGLCFQYPEHQLFESTVYEDIAFGPKNMGLSESEIKERVLESIKFVGLTEEYLDKSPFDLSGGEKRRVAIAGVISMKPKVLVLDEPTAGLDPVGKNDLLDLIKHYNKTTGSTVIFVSHNMDDVALIADRVLVLSEGNIVMNGTVEEVYSRGNELLKLGLDVPEITRVFLKLSEEGYDVPTDVYTVKDGKEKLVEFLKRGKLNG